jgi:adenylate kinase
MCRHCGKNYNIATIDLPATGGRPRIWMPPLPPPPECAPHLEQREDDTQEVVRRRLQVGEGVSEVRKG